MQVLFEKKMNSNAPLCIFWPIQVDRRKFEFNYVWIQFQFAENILSFRLSFLQSFLSRKEKLLLPAVPYIKTFTEN